MNAIVPVAHTFAYSDLERMAKSIASSKLFGIATPDQALALMLLAQAEGMHPATAARDYHLIQGRPAKKADAMLRDFLSAGGKVEWHKLDDTQADATFSHPSGGSARIDWTFKRATTAGISNPMWKKYPRQMLRSRVVSEGVRTVCPGATSGMYVPEEVQDIVHEDAPPVRTSANYAPVIEGEYLPIQGRKSAAQAKRDGDHTRINAIIDAATADMLDEFEENFEALTADLPMSWLDPLRNRIILRREEIAGEASVVEAEAEMDAGFRGAIGSGGERSEGLAERASAVAA